MFKCALEKIDWKKGYAAGLEGKLSVPPRDVDGLSWMSGYIEGKAQRSKNKNKNLKRNKAHWPVII